MFYFKIKTIKKLATLLFFSIILLLSYVSISRSSDVLNVYFRDQRPYHFVTPQGPRGFIYDKMHSAARDSGLDVRFESMPTKRILHMLSLDDTAPFCSMSWFKNEEREKIARYGRVLYVSEPYIAVFRKNAVRLPQMTPSVENLIMKQGFVVGVTEGLTYGQYVDGLVRSNKKSVYVSKDKLLFRMLHKGRFDFLFSTPDTIDKRIHESGLSPDEFVTYPLADLASGNKRYLICSRNIDHNAFNQLNGALEARYRPN